MMLESQMIFTFGVSGLVNIAPDLESGVPGSLSYLTTTLVCSLNKGWAFIYEHHHGPYCKPAVRLLMLSM